MIIGAAMIPNKMIIRYDELGNPYYVYFSKESIKKMAAKFLKEKRTDQASIEHDGKKLGSEKVFITESWVSEDPVYDKSHKYGFNLPSGSWFVSMKINDDSVWKMIKEKSNKMIRLPTPCWASTGGRVCRGPAAPELYAR